MDSTPAPSDSIRAFSASKGWLIAGGILSIFVGFAAIGSPLVFSLVIAQFLGIFALVSGVISLFLAIFGKHPGHRVLEGISALIRIAAGVVLLMCIASSVAVITLVFAIFLGVQGISTIAGSIRLKGNPGWVWTLINGVAALVLGLMVFYRWPGDSAFFLGLFFGISAIFNGMSYLMLGLAGPSAQARA